MAQRLALLAFGTFAIAVFSGMPPDGGARAATSSATTSDAASAPHGPPPEAIAACTGKTAGTTVSFTGRGGQTLTGVCQLDNGVLAARPTGGMGGPGGHGGPPPAPR